MSTIRLGAKKQAQKGLYRRIEILGISGMITAATRTDPVRSCHQGLRDDILLARNRSSLRMAMAFVKSKQM